MSSSNLHLDPEAAQGLGGEWGELAQSLTNGKTDPGAAKEAALVEFAELDEGLSDEFAADDEYFNDQTDKLVDRVEDHRAKTLASVRLYADTDEESGASFQSGQP